MQTDNEEFLTPEQLYNRWKQVRTLQRLQIWRMVNKTTGLGKGPMPTKIGPDKRAPVLYRIAGPKGVEAYEKGDYTHWDKAGNIYKGGVKVNVPGDSA